MVKGFLTLLVACFGVLLTWQANLPPLEWRAYLLVFHYDQWASDNLKQKSVSVKPALICTLRQWFMNLLPNQARTAELEVI